MDTNPSSTPLTFWSHFREFMAIFAPLAIALIAIAIMHYYSEYRAKQVTRADSEILNVDLEKLCRQDVNVFRSVPPHVRDIVDLFIAAEKYSLENLEALPLPDCVKDGFRLLRLALSRLRLHVFTRLAHVVDREELLAVVLLYYAALVYEAALVLELLRDIVYARQSDLPGRLLAVLSDILRSTHMLLVHYAVACCTGGRVGPATAAAYVTCRVLRRALAYTVDVLRECNLLDRVY